MDYRSQARELIKKRIVPIPLQNDSKLPSVKWKCFQERFPNEEEIDQYFKNCGGVATLTLPGKDKDNLISDLFLLDFDLKYQLDYQFLFKEFMSKVPENIKERFLINTSMSGNGRHIWFRTKNFIDKSRKLAYRLKTPEELLEDKKELLSQGKTEVEANNRVMKSLYKVIIETRGNGGYGVFLNPKIKREYGKKLQYLTKEETELVIEIAYSLSEFFEKREKFVGNVRDFKTIEQFNENTSASEIMDMLENTGSFRYTGNNSRGDLLFVRSGTSSKYSGKVFGDTGVTHIFSNNSILGDAGPYNPFSIYTIVNNLTKYEAVKKLMKEKY